VPPAGGVSGGSLPFGDSLVSPEADVRLFRGAAGDFGRAFLAAVLLAGGPRGRSTASAAVSSASAMLSASASSSAASAPPEQITSAQDFQRKAQFYLDFVEAENSSGFHAPQEALRILGESINFSRKGQIALRPLTQPRPENVQQ